MKQSIWGILSLILGILSLLTICVDLSLPFGFLGTIFAIIGIVVPNKKRGLAIAGLICSIIGMTLYIIAVLAANDLNNSLKQLGK